MSSEKDPFSESLPPEGVSRELIEEFHKETGRLYAIGVLKFGPGIGGNETDSDSMFSDRIRYKKDGTIITIVPFSDDIFGESDIDVSTSPVNVVIETPVPATPEWLNTYIFENFIFDAFNEPFTHHLSVKEYTPQGKEISDRASSAIMGEQLPALGQNITDWNQVSRLLGEGLKNVTSRKLHKLNQNFPDFMEEFKSENHLLHFQNMLELIKTISLNDEVGCSNAPFAR